MVGAEKKVKFVMTNMCLKKTDAINVSCLNASGVVKNYNKRSLPEDNDDKRNCFEIESRSPEIGSHPATMLRPKLLPEFDDPVIADDSDIACSLVDEFLDYHQAKNKNQQAAISWGLSSSSDEIIACVS